MWKKGCSAPWGRVRGILNALNPKVRQQATCFLRSLRCTCFYLSSLCPETWKKHIFHYFDVYVEKGLQRPLGKSQGHFKCIKSKGQTTSNMFFEVTKVHMFLFVLTMSWNMKEAYFSLFWRLCGKGLQRPLGKSQGHFKCIKSKGQTTSNMFFEVTKVHTFLFVLTVSLNMTEAYFPLFWHLCRKRAAALPGEGSEAFKCIKSKGQTTGNMFVEVTKVHMFLFVLTVSLNMTETYFSLFWRLCGKKGLQRPLGKGQGHFKCIKSKGQIISNMFFEVTKMHMFLFVLTVSLNMAEAYFPLFWSLCGKRVAAPPGEGSGAF